MKKKEQNAQETMNEAYLSGNGRDIWMSETREREREKAERCHGNSQRNWGRKIQILFYNKIEEIKIN